MRVVWVLIGCWRLVMTAENNFAQNLKTIAIAGDVEKLELLLRGFNKQLHQAVVEEVFDELYTKLDSGQNVDQIIDVLRVLYPIMGRDKALERTVSKAPDVEVHLAVGASFDEWNAADKKARKLEEDRIRGDLSDDFGANPTYQVNPKHQDIVSDILDKAEGKAHVHSKSVRRK